MDIKEAGVQTEGKVKVLPDNEEEKGRKPSRSKYNRFFHTRNLGYLMRVNLENSIFGALQKKDQQFNKMELLNSFKDTEVLKAFKLALISTNSEEDILSEEEFYNQVGKSFINILRRKDDIMSDELDKRLGELNIQSDSNTDNTLISDFGDIIPVNLDVECDNVRKHQKWTIGEQKKLIALINNKPLYEITDAEWQHIAQKLERTRDSVFQKAEEVSSKVPNMNKKRKVIEQPVPLHNDTTSSVSLSRADRDITVSVACSEYDANTEEQGRSLKTDCLFVSRKKAIETVLEQLPGRKGTKNQIFDAMMERYGLPLENKDSAQYKGFQQCLSKYFRHGKGFYALKVDSPEFEVLNGKLKSFGKFLLKDKNLV